MRKPQKEPFEALIDQLKIAACDARSKELYWKQTANTLEEAIRLLTPRKDRP